MGEELEPCGGNLFVVFGEPDVEPIREGDACRVRIRGVDLFKPPTGETMHPSHLPLRDEENQTMSYPSSIWSQVGSMTAALLLLGGCTYTLPPQIYDPGLRNVTLQTGEASFPGAPRKMQGWYVGRFRGTGLCEYIKFDGKTGVIEDFYWATSQIECGPPSGRVSKETFAYTPGSDMISLPRFRKNYVIRRWWGNENNITAFEVQKLWSSRPIATFVQCEKC